MPVSMIAILTPSPRKPGLPCHTDRKSTRLNSSHDQISYAVFCLKKKKERQQRGMIADRFLSPMRMVAWTCDIALARTVEVLLALKPDMRIDWQCGDAERRCFGQG